MSGKRRITRQPRQADESYDASPTASQGGGGAAAAASDSRRGSSSSLSAATAAAVGASSSSPTDQLSPQIDFQFLNFSHPSDAKTGKTRKAVRSHVTKQQHQRENAAAAARRAKGSPTRTKELEEIAINTRPQTVERSASSLESVPHSSSTAESPDASSASLSPATSPFRVQYTQLDPLEVFPQEWHPYIGRILEHYISGLINIEIPGLDGPDPAGILRTQWLPFVLGDRASMHAVMLVAASHYDRFRGSWSHAIDLLQLRGMAIHEINNALEDPVRALSDQLIAAVAKMAIFEALFGDRSTYNTHMTGLLRMVSLRGGLPALGLDGLLQRVLLWIDVNAAHATGSHIYFDKAAFPTSEMHPRPDPSRFLGDIV